MQWQFISLCESQNLPYIYIYIKVYFYIMPTSGNESGSDFQGNC